MSSGKSAPLWSPREWWERSRRRVNSKLLKNLFSVSYQPSQPRLLLRSVTRMTELRSKTLNLHVSQPRTKQRLSWKPCEFPESDRPDVIVNPLFINLDCCDGKLRSFQMLVKSSHSASTDSLCMSEAVICVWRRRVMRKKMVELIIPGSQGRWMSMHVFNSVVVQLF